VVSLQGAAHRGGLLLADSVEKVGHGFHGRKVRASDRNLCFEQMVLGSDFAQQRAKKTFSSVSMKAVWKARLFQQNRPIAGFTATRKQTWRSMCIRTFFHSA